MAEGENRQYLDVTSLQMCVNADGSVLRNAENQVVFASREGEFVLMEESQVVEITGFTVEQHLTASGVSDTVSQASNVSQALEVTGDDASFTASDAGQPTELEAHKDPLWTKDGVRRLIELCQQKDEALKDKKSRKKGVWEEIATVLSSEGLAVDGNKCHQKWRNLIRDYTNYKSHVKATGGGRRDPPWFFDLVDEFLGQRHTVHPLATADTLQPGTSAVSVEESATASCSAAQLEQPSTSAVEQPSEKRGKGKGKGLKQKASNTSKILEAIRESARQRADSDERLREELRQQHNEKMDLLRSFLDTFKKPDSSSD